MQTFDGFPPGKLKPTAVPARFFSDLLPLIDDLAELKVTLYCFWALHQKEGEFRYLVKADFTASDALLESLRAARPESDASDTLNDALDRAVARGSLLCVSVELDTEHKALYFVNTERGRRAVEQVKAGRWQPGREDIPVEILPERPNVYGVYEANIGPLTPLIVDALKEAEHEYPETWLHEAIQIAVERNARHWRFIRAVLERWKQEGRHLETAESDRLQNGQRYITGKYADWLNF